MDNFLFATEKDRLMLCKSLFASSIPWSEASAFKKYENELRKMKCLNNVDDLLSKYLQ